MSMPTLFISHGSPMLALEDSVAHRFLLGLGEALDYRAQAPFAVRNHPTEEHLLPLFVAMGPQVMRRMRNVCMRVMNMACWRWMSMPFHSGQRIPKNWQQLDAQMQR